MQLAAEPNKDANDFMITLVFLICATTMTNCRIIQICDPQWVFGGAYHFLWTGLQTVGSTEYDSGD